MPPGVNSLSATAHRHRRGVTNNSSAVDLRRRFPNAEEAPPLDPAVEWFGVPPAHRVSFRIGLPPNRWLLTDEQRNNLVQIQLVKAIFNTG